MTTNIQQNTYVFSGHDTFQCRHMWLKKGYEFVKEGTVKFSDEEAVIKLGVGKNMVSSIRYWLRAFNIIDLKDQITDFGKIIFDDNEGYDPYLEDIGSIWLLHYQLVKKQYASIFSLVYNEHRKEKLFFDKKTYTAYIKRLKEINSKVPFNINTLESDFTVFLKTYWQDSSAKEIEDSFSGILTEIELVNSNNERGDKLQISIQNSERDTLPFEILLFSILDNENYGNSISLNALENDYNGPSSIFALNRNSLLQKIEDITKKYKNVIYSDHAGIKELQFKTKENPFNILNQYYGKHI